MSKHLVSLSLSIGLAGICSGQEPTQASVQKAPPAAAGSVSLFDGKTLSGWVTEGGRYDGKARWTVEDGALTGREGPGHAGGLIYTDRRYSSFLFSCDTKISYPFDSGIFLRMLPRKSGLKGAQVTLDYRPDGEVGAIYADGFLRHNKDAKASFRRDAWNHVAVRCVGPDMHLQVWLNGELITDYRLPRNAEGYAPSGLIGLQVHGGRHDPENSAARFKNIKVIELPEYDDAVFTCDAGGFLRPTEAARELGWRKLFNGKDLEGWQPVGDPKGYAVQHGMLVFPKEGGGGYIHTKESFRDFELRLDFKISRMANSGLFLRGKPGGGDPAYSGCEIQILDDHNWEKVTGHALHEWQFTGSLYASVPPGVKHALRPLHAWNSYHVVYRGSRISVTLNGWKLYDVDTFEVPVAYASKLPFAKRAQEGFIGLQRHAPAQVEGTAYAWFKNIFIRKL